MPEHKFTYSLPLHFLMINGFVEHNKLITQCLLLLGIYIINHMILRKVFHYSVCTLKFIPEPRHAQFFTQLYRKNAQLRSGTPNILNRCTPLLF